MAGGDGIAGRMPLRDGQRGEQLKKEARHGDVRADGVAGNAVANRREQYQQQALPYSSPSAQLGAEAPIEMDAYRPNAPQSGRR